MALTIHRSMDKNKPAIQYIFTRMGHHSDHSGYDQIINYIPSTVQAPNFVHRLLSLCPERVLAHIRSSAGEWYNSYALKQELQNIPDFFLASPGIYHFLYGEDTFHYSGYLNPRKSNMLVATYHNPPEKFLKINRGTRHLKTLDALVIVAPNQEKLFKNLVNPDRVHLIPHGVDTHFFQPGQKVEKEKKRCLFVGTHLRDFAMLRRVIQELNKKDPEISITAITFKENFAFFEGLKNVTACSSISEEQLINYYTTSELLLLPLIDGTANNTILEAMACGLPVITTDVGGIAMYAEGGGAVLVERGDVSGMAERALNILHSESAMSFMSKAARKKAEQFDWAIIAQRMQRLYAGLFQEK